MGLGWTAVLALAIGTVASAAPRRAPTPLPDFGKVLIVGLSAEPVSLDCAALYRNEFTVLLSQIYEPLVRMRGDNTVEGVLARSWQHDASGRVWTFRLRPGVRFHDGTPLNARAVQFSMDRQRLVRTAPGDLGPCPMWRAVWGERDSLIHDIDAVDALTVRFRLTAPCASFLANLSRLQFAIISPTAYKKHGYSMAEVPVGTGPFHLEEWNRGSRLVLGANPAYWGGHPLLERVVYDFIGSGESRLEYFGRDRVDVVAGLLSKERFGIGGQMPGARVERLRDSFVYLALNCLRAPLQQTAVRRAVTEVVDRKAILAYFDPASAAASSPLPPGVWGRDGRAAFPEYRPGTARQTLQRVGVSGNVEWTLIYAAEPSPAVPQPDRVATEIQTDLTRAGVKLQVVPLGAAEWRKRLSRGDYDLALCQYQAASPDPDGVLFPYWDFSNARPGGTNYSFYRSRALQDLLSAARRETSHAARSRLYQEAQRVLAEDAPMIPLAYSREWLAASPRVVGLKVVFPGLLELQNVWLKP